MFFDLKRFERNYELDLFVQKLDFEGNVDYMFNDSGQRMLEI